MAAVLRQELYPEVKSIKIVARKGRLEVVAQLNVVARALQFLGSAANSKIVDKSASLLHRTLGDAPEFAKLEIS